MAAEGSTTAEDGKSTAEIEEYANAVRKETNKEFLHLLHEKDAVKTELVEMEKQFNQLQGRNYELLQRIDQLEKELSTTKEQLTKEREARPVLASTPKVQRAARPRTARHANPRLKQRTDPRKNVAAKSSTNLKKTFEAEKPAQEKDTYRYYEEIADRYPMLRLSVLLEAEKKFVEGDTNKDGTIDAAELEEILDSGQLMFTKQQVIDIVKEIDTDNSNSLDFMECLKVIDRLQQNKKTNLPTELEKNKSTVCSIQ